MEIIEKTIPYSRGDTFRLYPFSDSHLGSVESAENHLIKKVKECAELGRLGLAIGVGDWSDCITKNDKRFRMNGLADWVQKSDIIESQRERVKEIYSPLSEQGQLIGVGTGNHEETIHSLHDNDITRHYCKDLGVPYAGYQAFIVLKFRRKGGAGYDVVCHSWHGSGAAQTEGARLGRLMRLVNDIEADIYLMGHLHAITTHTPDRLVVRAGKLLSVRLAATLTGSWLKTYNQPEEGRIQDPTYGEEKGYKPARIGCPVVEITPDAFENKNKELFKIVS